ncbi:MAG: hypothetical protein OEY01_05555 [Desulfobulbaceae bacterium]|nr:hypothetical protein [Desulfobulbaceae bacterium]HIJ78575.1 hypothetical protein [Deltaproteobacteria bacterium]
MSMRICPFCREKIHRQAVVCRYCKRDQPTVGRRRKNSSGWLAAITATAVIVSATAFLVTEFIRERNIWSK